jgi:hypothetical protein
VRQHWGLQQTFFSNSTSHLTLYPNPTKDGKVSINSTSFEGMVHLELIDVSGKVIYSEGKSLFLGSNSLDVSYLSPGIYSLSINSNMENKVFKVVVL